MDEDQQQRDGVLGRSINVEAWGPDLDGLELAALDSARKFFGPEVRLEVVREYAVREYPMYEPARRYHANVTVREVTG
jgi:hypothetical protein